MPLGIHSTNLDSSKYIIMPVFSDNPLLLIGGTVFDFYAGTMKRAPLWWQKHLWYVAKDKL